MEVEGKGREGKGREGRGSSVRKWTWPDVAEVSGERVEVCVGVLEGEGVWQAWR